MPLGRRVEEEGESLGNLFCSACLEGVVRVGEPSCPRCGRPGVSRESRCRRCRGAVFGFQRAAAGAVYGGTVRGLMLRFKFGRHRPAARPLSHLVLAGAHRALGGEMPDCVVAVPLHPARRKQRGFNQAALLAVLVAKALEVPCLEGVVRRTRNTPPQGKGGGGSRRQNVRGAFAPLEDGWRVLLSGRVPGEAVQGCTVLLVDDVLSTGATLDHCSRALLSAGARRVFAAAAAT